MSTRSTEGRIASKADREPNVNRNIVQFYRLVIVLDDDAKVVDVFSQSEREWVRAA